MEDDKVRVGMRGAGRRLVEYSQGGTKDDSAEAKHESLSSVSFGTKARKCKASLSLSKVISTCT